MDRRFGKELRLTRGREFETVIRLGSCVADGTLVVFAKACDDKQRPSRLGITIPKRTGSAVVRNRWKRLIREAFRTQRQRLPVGYDFVVRPKKGAEPEWQAIRRSLPSLVRRADSQKRRKRGSSSKKRSAR